MLWSIDTTHSLCLCVWVCVSKFLFLIGIICYESESEVTQLCLTLCHPMDCSLPVSSVHGIFQARTLEWVAITFSRRSSQPRDWSRLPHCRQTLYHLSHQGSKSVMTHPNKLILTWLPLQRFCLHVRLHSKVVRVKTSTYQFWPVWVHVSNSNSDLALVRERYLTNYKRRKLISWM